MYEDNYIGLIILVIILLLGLAAIAETKSADKFYQEANRICMPYRYIDYIEYNNKEYIICSAEKNIQIKQLNGN